jgi:site-specific recombinase XerD
MMAWTRRQLDEAVTACELALQRAGRTAGTVTTYVGDVRRFVEWLAGSRDLEARALSRGSRAAYAAAERRADVQRASNVRDIEPEEYARRLLAGGVAKGWLR